ncbi:unnamed protein product [Tetraodon nigroviridis]|uniref:(spotted green pufferfish) hypothetical protein n=1 Tax=Tetraodon nigroviridis TaxID=99883 RepID=Q4T8L9_TETNG|nr:unnamed protein product [Tetraodon nigroviridis]
MTPGNGNAQSARRRAAEAPLESRVLTHLIEGFVIQEGAQPFPVERPSFSVGSLKTLSGDGHMHDLSTLLKGLQEPRLTCELCGKVDFASIFKRPRRFCSACAKRYSLGCTRRVALFPERRSSLEKGRSRRILSGTLRAVLLEYRKASAAPLCTSASRPAAPRLSAHRDPREPGVAAPQTPVAEGAELPASPCGPLPSEPGRWKRRGRLRVHLLSAWVSGDSRGVPLPGDRRPGAAAAEGGPPHGHHEHQSGPCAEDLGPDQLAQGLVASHTRLGGLQPLAWTENTQTSTSGQGLSDGTSGSGSSAEPPK